MVLYVKTNIHFLPYFTQIFLEGKMFSTIFVQKIETHILCSVFFFLKIMLFIG